MTKWGDWYMAMGEGQLQHVPPDPRLSRGPPLGSAPPARGGSRPPLGVGAGCTRRGGWAFRSPRPPFHLVGLLFGAPGFLDAVRFLLFYGATTVVLVRALHRVNPGRLRRPRDQRGSGRARDGAAQLRGADLGAVSDLRVHDRDGRALEPADALRGSSASLAAPPWGNLVALVRRRGLRGSIRPTPGGLRAHVPRARPAPRPPPVACVLAPWSRASALTGASAALYFVANWLRFGSPLTLGYANVIAGPKVNRLHRWGLSFHFVPLGTKVKELFASLFSPRPRGRADGRAAAGRLRCTRSESGGASTTRRRSIPT